MTSTPSRKDKTMNLKYYNQFTMMISLICVRVMHGRLVSTMHRAAMVKSLLGFSQFALGKTLKTCKCVVFVWKVFFMFSFKFEHF